MLFLVSTPIGNLKDISKRAEETLKSVQIIACEDTRTTKQLFTLLGLKTEAKLISYHEHNAKTATPKIIELLKKNIDIALVSDAGTPLISDPGFRLVRECRKEKIEVTTIPGANAVLSAIQLSGLPSDSFLFSGFLPPKSSKRKTALQNYTNLQATLVFYETPNRLIETLEDINLILGNREMAVVREITKKFEETKIDTVQNLIQFYTNQGIPKGELVLVIDRAHEETVNEEDVETLIKKTLKNNSLKDTVEIVTSITGQNKKEIYKKALGFKK